MGKHRKPSHLRRNVRAVVVGGAVATTALTGAQPAAAAVVDGPPGGWGPVIQCESGGSPTVVNSSGHAGLLQFAVGTWLRYGGGQYAPTADQATPAQQIAVAEVAYAAEGLAPWLASRSCWSGKVSQAGAPAAAAVAPHAAVPAAPKAPRVPARRSPLPAATAEGRNLSGLAEHRHVVVPGDTLSQIAVDAGLDGWQHLYQANRSVVGDNPDLIFPGQVLGLDG